MKANSGLQKSKGIKMAKNIIISEEIVRTRVMRVHSNRLRESMKHGFFNKKAKPQKRLFSNRSQKKGGANE